MYGFREEEDWKTPVICGCGLATVRGEQIAPAAAAAWPIRPSMRGSCRGRCFEEGKNIKVQSAIQSWENGKKLLAKTTKHEPFSGK